MIALLFIGFFILMFIGVPIAAALGVGALLVVAFCMNSSLVVSAQTMFTGINSFPLMAIPFFILAGNLMGEGGISKRLINFVTQIPALPH